MGEVIADSMKLCGRHLGVLATLVVVLQWLPAFADRQLNPLALRAAANLRLGFRPGDFHDLGSAAWTYRCLGWFVVSVASGAMQVAMARVALADHGGFQASIGDATKVTRSVLPQIVAITVILNVASLAFVVAAVRGSAIDLLPWSLAESGVGVAIFAVVGPVSAVLAAEWRGVVQTLSRSVELTDRHRWSLFGLYMCVFFAELLLGMVLGLTYIGLRPFGRMVQNLSVSAVGAGLINAVWSVMLAMSYRELCRIKEGRSPADAPDIAAILD